MNLYRCADAFFSSNILIEDLWHNCDLRQNREQTFFAPVNKINSILAQLTVMYICSEET